MNKGKNYVDGLKTILADLKENDALGIVKDRLDTDAYGKDAMAGVSLAKEWAGGK